MSEMLERLGAIHAYDLWAYWVYVVYSCSVNNLNCRLYLCGRTREVGSENFQEWTLIKSSRVVFAGFRGMLEFLRSRGNRMAIYLRRIHAVLGIFFLFGILGALFIASELTWVSVIAIGGWGLIGAVYIHRSIVASVILWASASILFPPAIVLGAIAIFSALLVRLVFRSLNRVELSIKAGSREGSRLEAPEFDTDSLGNDAARPDYTWGILSRNPGLGEVLWGDDPFDWR